MLTICIVSKSMDMETMLTGGKAFDFSCQLHRGRVILTDQDNTVYQENTKDTKELSKPGG